MTEARPDTAAIDQMHMSAEWEEVRQRQVLASHWARRGWWTGREAYYWMIRFDGDDAVAQLATSCQATLRHRALDLVPRRGLHLTLSRIGFTDEVDVATALGQVGLARRRLVNTQPIPVRVGPLAGSGGAIRLIVTPRQPLTALRDRIRTLPATGDEFRPHVSVGYLNRQTAAAPLIERVRDIRHRLRPVLTTVDAIQLVLLRREEHRYELETLEVLPLVARPHDA